MFAEEKTPHFQHDRRNSAAPVNKYMKSKLIIHSKICIWLCNRSDDESAECGLNDHLSKAQVCV